MQTRKRSWAEAILGTAVGMGYAIPLNYVMIAHIKWPDPWVFAVVSTVLFTILSILLKFGVRRFFNWYDHHKPSKRP